MWRSNPRAEAPLTAKSPNSRTKPLFMIPLVPTMPDWKSCTIKHVSIEKGAAPTSNGEGVCTENRNTAWSIQVGGFLRKPDSVSGMPCLPYDSVGHEPTHNLFERQIFWYFVFPLISSDLSGYNNSTLMARSQRVIEVEQPQPKNRPNNQPLFLRNIQQKTAGVLAIMLLALPPQHPSRAFFPL